MKPLIPSDSPMIASLDRLIDLIREQAKAMRGAQYPGGSRRGDKEEIEKASAPSHRLEDLDIFIGRLQQVKEWLNQDPQLLHLVDRHMSQHVQSMEKHQARQNLRFAVITTVAGVILGWLASALASPLTLWHLLFH